MTLKFLAAVICDLQGGIRGEFAARHARRGSDSVADRASRVMRDHAPIQRDGMNETLEAPLIIGLHHLTRLRAYIAYGERVLYISAADAQ